MSTQETTANNITQIRKYERTLQKAYSTRNRRNFLQNCIAEKVIPKSTSRLLHTDDHPFPPYIHEYLLHCERKLKVEENELFDEARILGQALRNILSTNHAESIRMRISSKNQQQTRNLKEKLKNICDNSKWTTTGNTAIINNLSRKILTPYEKEALSFGLKFATGIPKKHELAGTITTNYRSNDDDFIKGYIQGIITCTTTQENQLTIPRRYITALKNLSKDESIIISPSDKGGGVVILNTIDYDEKMKSLLHDKDIYQTVTLNEINSDIENFNKSVRRILKKHNMTSWNKLIEKTPKIPHIYGLPKTHKEDIPLRPITSGLNSAPHKIAKEITKTLTPLLGTISPAHIKHSGDLLTRLRGINNTRLRKLISLDIKSLYTNIPVKTCLKKIEDHLTMKNVVTPIPIKDFMKLIDLCTSITHLQYKDQYYIQNFGLPMGSPLSGAIACLYLEFLETGPLKDALPKNSTYLRYIDDTLLICPTRTNIEKLVQNLNKIDDNIQFTHEEENNNSLPFLDIMIHRTNDGLQYSVYRKPTFKNDLIHYYSHHDVNIKSGTLIGLHLRALRICSPDYLEDEFNYIDTCFTQLKYPKSFIKRARQKALKISRRTTKEPQEKRRLTLPHNNMTHQIKKILSNDFQIVTKSTNTIKAILQRSTKSTEKIGGVYKIPCTACPQEYIGETSRKLEKRIKEHKYSLKTDDPLSAVAQHRTQHNHRIDLQKASFIYKEDDSTRRKLIESATIQQHLTFQQRPGFYNLAPPLSRRITQRLRIQTRPPSAMSITS